MWTAPEYFTPAEVQEINELAKSIPLDEGRTGGGQHDPDAIEQSEFYGTNEIRQSQVKWFTPPQYRMPQHIVDKINQATDEKQLDKLFEPFLRLLQAL